MGNTICDSPDSKTREIPNKSRVCGRGGIGKEWDVVMAVRQDCEDEDVCDNTVLRRLIGRSVGHTLLDSRSLLVNEVRVPRWSPFLFKVRGFEQICASFSLARGRAILVGPDACYKPVSGTARPEGWSPACLRERLDDAKAEWQLGNIWWRPNSYDAQIW